MRQFMLAVLIALAAVSAHAGTKTVKDWTAVCDNIGTCSAYGFSPEDGDGEDSYLRLTRAAGGGAAPKLTIVYDAPDKQPTQSLTLSLDGKPIAGIGPLRAVGSDEGARATLTGAPAQALIAATRQGTKLSLDQGGKPLQSISLAGSAAILLWVDDQQGRVGTVTALTQAGAKPASSVPGPRPIPLVSVAAPVAQTGLPKQAPKGLINSDPDCETIDTANETDLDVVARLAPGQVLWGPICDVAAYNDLNIFFVGDEHAGHMRKLAFPEPAGSQPATDDSLMNVEFKPKTQTLSAYSKGRGLGDCGAQASWVWDGQNFQLLGETSMTECRGVVPDDWPTLYVAHRKPSP